LPTGQPERTGRHNRTCRGRAILGLFGLVIAASAVRADATQPVASPLRLIPAEADLLLHIRQPARLLDSVQKQDVVGKLQALPAIKEQLDGTAARRLRQILAHFEKTLGAKYPDLIDRLAGGGIALATKFGNKQPTLVIVQGKDEKLMQQFLECGVEVIEAELSRQDAKQKVQKGEYLGIPGYRIGDLYLARVDATLVVSNNKDAMARALQLHRGKEGSPKRERGSANGSLATHPAIVEAGKLLPAKCLATMWINMEPAHQSEAGKNLYKSPRDEPLLTVLFGSYLDVLGRTPYVCAGLVEETNGYTITLRAPRGRESMGPDRLLHQPPDGQPGSRPLLEPKGVLYSTSFYRDVASIWKDREKLFPKGVADNLTKSDKSSGLALGGVKLSRLLESVGPYQRVVVVNQGKTTYKKQPQSRIPGFALVSELRDPEGFGKRMDSLLRVGGLFLTAQLKLELKEETYKDIKLVAYRFDEKAVLKDDATYSRFNYTPCFARVGNQFIFSSTVELGRDLVDLLLIEQKSPSKSDPGLGGARGGGPSFSQTAVDRYYANGFADLLQTQEDALITQTILDQAVPPGEAKKQVEAFIRLVRTTGGMTTSASFEAKTTRFDIQFRLRK